MESKDTALAAALRSTRAKKRDRQKVVAELLGVCRHTYMGWEVGRCHPRDQYWEGIATYLGASIEDVRVWNRTEA